MMPEERHALSADEHAAVSRREVYAARGFALFLALGLIAIAIDALKSYA